jgi:hypothetical protein
VTAAESRRDAEAELAAREERRQQFELRPLSLDERTRYSEQWQAVQAQFVDDPAVAVVRADSLIQSVMADRGYPIDEFEQRAADLSVDHPRVVENYRTGHRLFEKTVAAQGSTEDLRHAMRALPSHVQRTRRRRPGQLSRRSAADANATGRNPGPVADRGGVTMSDKPRSTSDLADAETDRRGRRSRVTG